MGILDFLRGKHKSQVVEALDLSWLKADMHSHLIPGIDDGAKTMEDSLELIRQLADLGLSKIITTPHIMSEYYRNTPEIISSGLEEVQKAAGEAGIHISIQAAAEYYLDEYFMEKVKNGEKLLCIHDNYVLVETGFISKPIMLEEVFFNLELSGYKPIFAHPERYQYLLQDRELAKDLLDRDVYFQVNLLSLTGFYSRPVKEFAEWLVEEQKVKLFGTDCHNQRYLDMLLELPKSRYYDKIRQMDLINHQI